jgi:SAM-dependent methyltransferase
MPKTIINDNFISDEYLEYVTPDYRIRHERDLQEISGNLARATSGNAYSWIKKGIIGKKWVTPIDVVLEIGCGVGRNLAQIPQTVGVDICLPYLKTAQNYMANQLLQADAYYLPFRERVFDVVIMTEVIEHITDHHSVLSEVARVLRPKGKFIISTPNRNLSRFARIPGHVHELNYKDIRISLLSEGFEIVERKGSTIPYVPASNPFVWLDSNRFFFPLWKALNWSLSPFTPLKWDLVILTQLK